MNQTKPSPTIEPTVIVIGGANMDIMAQSSAAWRRADSNPGQVRCAAGGVARNVAHNLALLGHDATLVSVLGQDAFGQAVLQATQGVGVDTRHCALLDDASTATYVSLHGADGDMDLAVNDMAIMARLNAGLLGSMASELASASCLVLDCNLHEEALAFLLGGNFQAPVFVDAVSASKCARLLPWLAGVHTLKLNRLEAAVLTGLAVTTQAQAQAAVLALQHQGVRQVVLSLGQEGVVWCDADGMIGFRAARELRVLNTCGAGDALLAGLVHGHLQGWALPRAVSWAMACAEITLQSPSANASELSAPAVQARLTEHPVDTPR